MQVRRIIGLGIILLLCGGCVSHTVSPVDTRVSKSAASSHNGATVSSKVLQQLNALYLPGQWASTIDKSGSVLFALPSVYANTRNPVTDHDYFAVHSLAPDSCTKEYALQAAQENWGPTVPAAGLPKAVTNTGGIIGYTWIARDGVAGNAPPNYRDWCVHHSGQGMDLEISAMKADTNTASFIESVFIPAWLKVK